MSTVLALVLVSCVFLGYAKARPQFIQDAIPLNVDLSNPSSNHVPEVEEAGLGGYQPHYPPYFPTQSHHQQQNHQQQQQPQQFEVYRDKEYYTRGQPLGPQIIKAVNEPSRIQFGRDILPPTRPGYQLQLHYSNSGYVKTGYSFSSVRFPVT